MADHPLALFDFAPTPMLFRRDCLDDYCWDPRFVIGASHLDFYVGHWRETDWSFGVCPEVCIPHYPGGGEDYLSNRHDPEKLDRDRDRFLEKWGYAAARPETDWVDSRHGPKQGLLSRARAVYENEGALSLASRATRYGLSRLL